MSTNNTAINNIYKIYFSSELKNKIRTFRNYKDFLEAKLIEEKDKIEFRYPISEDATDAMLRAMFIYRNFDSHDEIFRKSILISIYSFLEHFMNSICIHLSDTHPTNIVPKDLNGSGIDRSKIYLQKIQQLNFSNVNNEWSNLKDMQKIRNCIVHADGDLNQSSDKNNIQDIISKTSGLSIVRDHLIDIDSEYIDKTITTVEVFLNFIINEKFQ